MAGITSSKTFQMCFWAGLVIVLAGIAWVGLRDRNEPHTPEEVARRWEADHQPSHESEPAPAPEAPAAPPVDAAPAVEVTAGDLFRDYVRDQDAADAKYLHKRLLVKGIVQHDAGTLIELEAAGGRDKVNAWFADDAPKRTSRLQHYDVVTLACTGNGFAAVPELKDCVIEPAE